MRSLATVWTKHLKDPQKKRDFEQAVRHSTLALGRFKQILQDELDSLENVSTSLDEFDSPSWAFKQAYRNGEKARIKKTLELLSFLED